MNIDIHSSERFAKILKRERARADRVGTRFSVINYNIEGLKAIGASSGGLIKFLSQRIRLTDELGWIDEYHIGVLLHNTYMDGAGKFADSISEEINVQKTALKYNIYPYPVPLSISTNGNDPCQQQLDAIFCRNNDVSLKKHTDFCKFNYRVPALPSFYSKNAPSDDYPESVGDIRPFIIQKLPLWKRLMDIAGALFGIIFLSPIFLLISLFIKITTSGPILFKQHRVGYGGEVFQMWKFRTMKVNSDSTIHEQHVRELLNNDQPMNKLKKDPRLIAFGGLLRTTCLDELPQLINVLKGEMSLVGPRPDPVYAVEDYPPWYNARFDIYPGITGLWQVSGKNRTTFKEMLRLDMSYSRKVTFWQDLKILLLTLPAIILNAQDNG